MLYGSARNQIKGEAAEQWAVTTSTVSFTCLGLDLIMVVLLVALRHHRPIQSEGLGFLCCLLMGCMFGHIASLMDGLTPSAEGCRGRLALIYVFIYVYVDIYHSTSTSTLMSTSNYVHVDLDPSRTRLRPSPRLTAGRT